MEIMAELDTEREEFRHDSWSCDSQVNHQWSRSHPDPGIQERPSSVSILRTHTHTHTHMIIIDQ